MTRVASRLPGRPTDSTSAALNRCSGALLVSLRCCRVAGEGKGDQFAYTSGGARPSGLTETAGAVSWAGHPAAAIIICAASLLPVLLVAVVVITALLTAEPRRP